ncbi:FxsA family protein [Defluviimonas sp. WL0002]|uniref:FxsA family protein n=1 Tax=Albidovulum marisflavi TaxID=2984159 RepID=A0ABT2Z875_9RHOB|nr:FxsA family protein [Defluviimonas sp. WL0002]MCV2867272.1 FxsA family protein [Defluviimonas sp. WL0002]
MWLLVAFVLVPMIEIGLFIKVGGLIGIGWTLVIVLATAIAGSWLVRVQGLRALADLRGSLNDLRDPTEPIAHGALILFAGALLLTPGFFTDAMGLSLLLPPVRAALLRYLAKKVRVERFTVGGGPERPRRSDDVIDGDFTVVDPEKRPTHKPSGWTRH